MLRMFTGLLLLVALGAGASAQERTTPEGYSRVRVTVTGEALVTSQPDTAVLQLAVVTQSASAAEAQAQNAARTEAVVRALREAAGAGAEVKTSGYSVQPQYAYKEGAPPSPPPSGGHGRAGRLRG